MSFRIWFKQGMQHHTDDQVPSLEFKWPVHAGLADDSSFRSADPFGSWMSPLFLFAKNPPVAKPSESQCSLMGLAEVQHVRR